MKIVSLNVAKDWPGQLTSLVNREQPDIVCTQETRLQQPNPFNMYGVVEAESYKSFFGRRYGVATWFKKPLWPVDSVRIQAPYPEFATSIKKQVLATRMGFHQANGLWLINCHMHNGYHVTGYDSEKWAAHVEKVLNFYDRSCAQGQPGLIIGDMNTNTLGMENMLREYAASRGLNVWTCEYEGRNKTKHLDWALWNNRVRDFRAEPLYHLSDHPAIVAEFQV